MRIQRLVLQNFAPILAGTGKETIELDLSSITNRMIVFIGPIGSGKTYILSHLQPFATVGSLDVRNADDPIIEGKDGLKIIEYDKDGHEYVITHTYTWTGKSHAKKHSIIKDGTELNPNGNRSSFLDLIQLEFGIDESFLRLVRVGANVANFISMKATERKSFVANLLKDTETYLYLYKCWSGELREINTKVNILMNKITTFSKTPLEELKAQMQDFEDDRRDIAEKCDSLKEKRANLKGEANAILDGESIQSFLQTRTQEKDELTSIKAHIIEMNKELDTYTELPSEKEINQKIGKAESDLARYTEERQELTEAYESSEKEYQKLLDRKAMQGDPEHQETLKAQYDDMLAQMKSIESAIDGFDCKYSTSQLESLLEDLQSMGVLLNQIVQYGNESILFAYRADSSIIQYSNKKVEILNARKLKVQRLMNNLQFSEDYQAQQLMFRPPFCPTDTCPYFTTHPVTIKRRDGGKANFDPQMLAYQEELKDIDVDIYKYSEYPFLYSKIMSLREYWRNLSPILKDIGALNIHELKKVIDLSGYHQFYDYDKIIDTIDLVRKRNLYYELTEAIKSIKNELSQLDLQKDDNLDAAIKALEGQRESMQKSLEEKEKALAQSKREIEALNEDYLKLSNMTMLKSDLAIQQEREKYLVDHISKMDMNHEKLNDITLMITNIDKELTLGLDKLNSVIHKIDGLRTKINDITYTTKELDGILEEQKYLSAMCDAVGSKKGIPMKMVKLFFDSCRETINDFLYMVSEDNFEILDFEVTEKEFKIPYYTGGVAIDDISKASQGQSSLTSIAISFALVKELSLRSTTSGSYFNTVLLDEPDSAIHKSDKPKLLSILMKFLDDIQSEQCFIITHNDDLLLNSAISPQIIVTSNDEVINQDKYPDAIFI